jgi:putative addiction module antidote
MTRDGAMKLEIKKIGNSTGLILPKELLARLGLKQGDSVVLTETPDGFAVSRGDETFEKGMELAREAMKTYRNALKELAK